MPDRDDYTLSIEEVGKRLNKSIRTIHRYKDAGKLTFVVGASQGNPLYFSRSEIEALVRPPVPAAQAPAPRPPEDPQFWDRLERVERLLAMLDANPSLERLLTQVGEAKLESRPRMEALLDALLIEEQGRQKVDNQSLGRLLVRLGELLIKDQP